MNASSTVVSNNPFEAPLADLVAPTRASAIDAEDRKLRRCRNWVRTVSILYYVVGCFSGVGFLAGVYIMLVSASSPDSQLTSMSPFEAILITIFAGSWSAIFLTTAHGLRTFEKRSLWWARGLSIFWLLRFPGGTLTGALVLLALCNGTAKRLFEEESKKMASCIEDPSTLSSTTPKRETRILPVLLLMAVLALGCFIAFLAFA